jgi:superoxide reductase
MTKSNEIYKCDICGNVVEVLHTGAGELVCCGQAMKLREANTVDASSEKHVPIIERVENGFRVVVGSTAHPMEDVHHIEWIELIADEKVFRRFLRPGQEPSAEFAIKADKLIAREYCNIHGLWQAEF